MMPPRRELFQALAEMADHYPEMRFGQLVQLLCALAGGEAARELYEVGDDELLAAARHHLAEKASPAVP